MGSQTKKKKKRVKFEICTTNLFGTTTHKTKRPTNLVFGTAKPESYIKFYFLHIYKLSKMTNDLFMYIFIFNNCYVCDANACVCIKRKKKTFKLKDKQRPCVSLNSTLLAAYRAPSKSKAINHFV